MNATSYFQRRSHHKHAGQAKTIDEVIIGERTIDKRTTKGHPQQQPNKRLHQNQKMNVLHGEPA
jgi:hypothetical protein